MVNKTLTIIIFSCLYIFISNSEIGKNRSENSQNTYIIYIYTYNTLHAPQNRGLIIIYRIGGGGGGPLEKCVVL